MIVTFLRDLRSPALQMRHWLEIFQLIKAPHLKNSTTFTIVNLREYHIQNYAEEIQAIIKCANTEMKYEEVFRAIRRQWDDQELKIIPYKDSLDSYIMVDTDLLINNIEENLGTLEGIMSSPFAAHIRHDIEEQIANLRSMLKNLEVWVDA